MQPKSLVEGAFRALVATDLNEKFVIAHPLFAEFRFVLKVAIDMDVFR